MSDNGWTFSYKLIENLAIGSLQSMMIDEWQCYGEQQLSPATSVPIRQRWWWELVQRRTWLWPHSSSAASGPWPPREGRQTIRSVSQHCKGTAPAFSSASNMPATNDSSNYWAASSSISISSDAEWPSPPFLSSIPTELHESDHRHAPAICTTALLCYRKQPRDDIRYGIFGSG